MIKAVIFDFFGVLYGSGFRNIYNQLGGDVVKDYAYIKKYLDQTNAGELSHDDFAQIVATKLGLTIEEYNFSLQSAEQPNFELFDFIAEELKHKYKLAIISNAGIGTLEKKVSTKLLSIFDAVTVSGEIGIMKPDPAIFNYTLGKLDLTARESVFVDDLEGFVESASNLGLHGIQYVDFSDFKTKFTGIIERNS